MGEAKTTVKLSVVSKKDIIVDSQHPGGLEKIQHLEDTSRFSRRADEEVVVTQKPRFLGPLKGTNKIVEAQRAHFEARVEPQNDPTMKLDWYFNGKLIQSANRIQTYHDFGYVALDILSVRGEDSGTYTVVARNALGEAQLSASMVVESKFPKFTHNCMCSIAFFFSTLEHRYKQHASRCLRQNATTRTTTICGTAISNRRNIEIQTNFHRSTLRSSACH